MKTAFPDTVTDTNRAVYALDGLLGRGGQGAVLRVRGRALAVKLVDARHPSAKRRVREGIARVRRLPLEGLNVARPLRALAPPDVGYVMELMTGMEPLEKVVRVPRKATTDFGQWYLDTGSLRRRLRVLANTADLLAALHARGLTYGDTSPNNVFVSRRAEHAEVWLIDCDNIFAGVSPRAVYTPGYAAPELLGGQQGADSLTDAWSFAIIAFEALCCVHPFVGDLVHDGDPEIEHQAFAGLLPWIDDPEDRANESSRGLPRPMVLTTPLRTLAAQCFGASRTDRLRRPGVGRWAEKLHQAADQVLVCPACGSSYYLNSATCPWCDEPRPAFVQCTVHLRDPALNDDARTPARLVSPSPGRPKLVARVAVQEEREAALSLRQLSGAADSAPVLRMRLDGTDLIVRGEPDCPYALVHRRRGTRVELGGQKQRVDLTRGKSSWWLEPDDVEGLHRVVVFERREARR